MQSIRRNISARPLVGLALAAIVGIEFGDFGDGSQLPWIVAGAILMAIFAWWHANPILVWISTALVFAAWHQPAIQTTRAHLLFQELEHHAGGKALLVGRIERALRRDLPGATPGTFWFHASTIIAPQLGKRFEGPAVIRLVTDRRKKLLPGLYRIQGVQGLASTPDNPGQFDYRENAIRHGITAECRAYSIKLLKQDSWNYRAALSDAAESCREWIKEQLSVDLEDAPEERALIQATILGGSEAHANEVVKPFRETGTIHIFAVAGLHVGIIAYILAMFLRAMSLRRQWMLLVLMPLLFGYAFVTGLRPSTSRAAVMAAAFLAGPLVLRRSDLLNSLGGAALVILIFDSQEMFTIGFKLSFCVMTAIAVLEPRIRAWFQRWIDPDPYLPKVLLSRVQRRWMWLKGYVAGLFSVSLAATCGSLPIMLYYFHSITPSAVVANMILVPIAFMIIFTNVLALVSAGLRFHGFQLLLCNANLFLAKGAWVCALWFSHLPGAYWYFPPARPIVKPPVEFTVLRLPGGAAAQHLRVGAAHWLLDCGHAKDYAFQLHPYLQNHGVTALAGLILSHSDAEHVGGTTDLLHEYGIGAVYQPALEPWRWESSRSALRKLYKEGLRARPLGTGDCIRFGKDHGVEVQGEVLYPPRDVWPKLADDRALVMRVSAGRYHLLWCNDSGFIAEKTILDAFQPEQLRCDVIVRNQHPTDLSMTDEFLDAARPRILISSNNNTPPEQKLPQRLRDACRKRGIQLMDQAETGAVTIEVWPDRMEAHPFLGGAGAGVKLPPMAKIDAGK